MPRTHFVIEKVEDLPVETNADLLPLVTIVILSFNRKEPLKITLRKIISELRYPAAKKEIIVVENASTDGTAEMVRTEFPSVQLLVQSKNLGISGWNAGFKAGKGDYFLALDDDCYMEGNALLKAVANAKGHGADLISFTVYNPEEAGFCFNRHINTGIMGFWGCAALLSRSAIDKLHGFDSGIFVYVHEAEFCMRLFDSGFKHLFLPSVEAWHMKPGGLKPSAKGMQNVMRSLAYISLKRFAFPHAVRVFVRVLLHCLKQGKNDSKNFAPYITAALRGGIQGLRDRSPVSVAISDAYATNYHEFLNPLKYGGPMHLQKMAAFYETNADLYKLSQPTTIQFV